MLQTCKRAYPVYWYEMRKRRLKNLFCNCISIDQQKYIRLLNTELVWSRIVHGSDRQGQAAGPVMNLVDFWRVWKFKNGFGTLWPGRVRFFVHDQWLSRVNNSVDQGKSEKSDSWTTERFVMYTRMENYSDTWSIELETVFFILPLVEVRHRLKNNTILS